MMPVSAPVPVQVTPSARVVNGRRAGATSMRSCEDSKRGGDRQETAAPTARPDYLGLAEDHAFGRMDHFASEIDRFVPLDKIWRP